MAHDQFAPVLWGLGGALIYAGPRLSACAFAAVDPQISGGHGKCVFDFIVSLVAGAICAGAFTGAIAGMLSLTPYPAAVAAMVGLTANKVAPMITDAAASLVVNTLNGKFLELLKGPK